VLRVLKVLRAHKVHKDLLVTNIKV
jgi:hypothetical protein